mmetsp:Transcript_25862/g.46882  ORF Transcript_25862/g.46882 Transcript_25862/m.46882 type:complete len:102 (-) Transcript_25862:1676-1981(-)
MAMALVLGSMGTSQCPPSKPTTPLPHGSLTPPRTSLTPLRTAAQNCIDETFVATAAAIETLPKWNNTKLVGTAMTKKKRNRGGQSSCETFANKAVSALSAA